MRRTSVAAGIATVWLFTSLVAGGCGGNDFSTVPGKGGAGGKGGSASGSSGSDAGESSTGTGGTDATGGKGGKGGSSGNATGGSGGSGPVSDATCAQYIHAYCAWSARCTDYVYGGSVEACETLSATSCAWYSLPGTGWNEATFGACVAGYESADCAPTVAICETPRGKLQNGLECLSAEQCESNYCAISTSYCGVCGPDPKHALGGECEYASRDCQPALDCVEGTCVAAQEEGGTCDDVRHCSYARRDEGYLYCVEGTCQVVGLPGEPCFETELGSVLCGWGAACTTENVCVTYLDADDGEVCGTFADEVIGCPDGSCEADNDDSTVGHCRNWAGAGERCDKVPGFSRCATGLTCENDFCVWAEPRGPSDACDT